LLTMHAAMVELVRKMKAWKQRSKKAKAWFNSKVLLLFVFCINLFQLRMFFKQQILLLPSNRLNFGLPPKESKNCQDSCRNSQLKPFSWFPDTEW
jgi:hypothetical protein